MKLADAMTQLNFILDDMEERIQDEEPSSVVRTAIEAELVRLIGETCDE